jgi:hypothetical protein
MALDKENSNPFYLFGRYVAVVERSNGEPLRPSQLENIFQNTNLLTRYDRNKANFADLRMEIISKVSADGWPEKVLDDADGGRFWVGYYHQKAELPMMYVESVTHHTPDKVAPVESNEIDELRDA